jgi:hypothetical protein
VKVHIEASVVIDRPVEEVFDFIAVHHRENHARWDTVVSRLEPETPGPMGVGARFTIVRRNLRREEARTFTVTEWDPPRRMTMRTSAPDFDLILRGDFEPIDSTRSRHTLTGEAHVAGPRGLLAPVMRLKFGRDIAENLRRIKALVEGAPAEQGRPATAPLG